MKINSYLQPVADIQVTFTFKQALNHDNDRNS